MMSFASLGNSVRMRLKSGLESVNSSQDETVIAV